MNYKTGKIQGYLGSFKNKKYNFHQQVNFKNFQLCMIKKVLDGKRE